MTYNPKWLENSPDTELGGFNGASGSNTVVPTQDAVKSFIYGLTEDVREPSGVANRSTTSLTYDTTSTAGQCTVKFGPDTEDAIVYLKGKKYIFDTEQTITLPDTEGLHYVYYDLAGTLVSTVVFDINIIRNYAFIAVVYWNATDKEVTYFGDERHGISMSGDTHYNLHQSQGTVYLTGLALGDITTDSTSAIDADAQFSITTGSILDEDIISTIPTFDAPANIPVLYFTNTGYARKTTPDDFPLANAGTGRMAWNEFTGGAWQLTEAANNSFVLMHIYATNGILDSTFALVGQNNYATLSEARDGAETEINSIDTAGLPFQEFVIIATVIFETSDSFINTPKAIIRSTNTGSDYQDWRLANLNASGGGSGASDHGQLSGLSDDDHIQYAILSGARAFIGEQEFASGVDISAGDLTVNDGMDVFVGATSVANIGSTTQTLGVVTDTNVAVDQTANTVSFESANSTVGTFGSTGLALASGTSVSEFSTDGTLVGNSDTAVPTEQAVKTYVDTSLAGFALNRIYEGDSEVIVDDTTAAGEVRITTDGVDRATFSNTTVALGDVTNTVGGKIQINHQGDPEIAMYSAGGVTPIFSASNDTVSVGYGGLMGMLVSILNSDINFHVNSVNLLEMTETTQLFGRDGLTYLYLDQLNNIARLHASSSNYLVIDDTTGSGGGGEGGGETTMRYYDASIESLRVNTSQHLFGYLDDVSNTTEFGGNGFGSYFGIDRDNEGSTSGFFYRHLGIKMLYADGQTQQIGRAGSPHFKSDTATVPFAGIFSDSLEDFGIEVGVAQIYIGAIPGGNGIEVEDLSSQIKFRAGSIQQGQFDATGFSLRNGTNVSEFSTDSTLSGNSNDAVPTEFAVKTYVDNQIGGAVDHNSTTGKQGGTTAEYYHLTSDEYAGIYATSATLFGIGSSGSTNVEVDNTANSVSVDANGVEVANFTDNIQQIGTTGDTFVSVNQTANTVSITAGNESQILVETTGTSIYDDLTITGNLYVDGTTFVVNNQEVTTADNIIVLNDGEGGAGVTAGAAGIEIDRGTETNYRFVFDELTDTFRIGEVGALQAVATREDAPIDLRVPWWNDTANRFDTAGSDFITVDTATHQIQFSITSTQATITADGLILANGVSVNEFSTDGTLSGVSNDAVPTELAVKTYVDAQVSAISTRKIEDGDSYVLVNDATGGAGEITIVVDGIEVAYYDAQATSQRMGKLAGGYVETNDTSVNVSIGATDVFDLTADTQRMGVSGDTYLTTSQSGDEVAAYAAGTKYLSITDSSQIFGDVSGNNFSFVDTTSTFNVNTETVIDLSEFTQIIGINGTNDITISQTANDITFTANSAEIATINDLGLQLVVGATVDEFSIDGTLSGNSNTAVPTEAAVKTYVDTAIGGVDTVRFVDSDTTAVAGDIVLVDSTAGPVNVELLESTDGKITVKKITGDTNGITVFTSPGTIDGKASVTIDTPYQAFGLVSDGSDFFII